jgi:hypothetical protein
MHLHRYFSCINGCLGRIYIPLAIPAENARTQIPWPRGVSGQAFLCSECSRATEFIRGSLVLDPVPPWEDWDICRDRAVYKLSMPCGIDHCESVVEIHLVAANGSILENVIDLVPEIYAHNLTCAKGIHRHSGRCFGTSSLSFSVDNNWKH